MDKILSIPLPNLIAVCVFALLAIGLVLFFLFKNTKGVNIKMGNNQISFNNDEQRNAIVKIVTDYADFKLRLRENSYGGIADLKTQARRYVNIQIDQYIQRLTIEYITSLKDKKDQHEYVITINVFPLILQTLRPKLVKFFMEMYEQNHLKDLTVDQIASKTKVEYGRISDLCKEHFQLNWFDQMFSYETLSQVCMSMAPFVETFVRELIVNFVKLSNLKFELINLTNEVDTDTRMYVQKTGKLFINSLTLVDDFYINGIGLNKDSIDEYLKNIKEVI